LLPREALKDLLSQKLSDQVKLLICLAVQPVKPREVKEVKALGSGHRLAGGTEEECVGDAFPRTFVGRPNGKWLGAHIHW